MAIRKIVKEPDEVLRKKSREVEKFDAKLHQLLDDMTETLKLAEGVGLAAPQVGVLKRVVVIIIDDQVIELINPKIVATAETQTDYEGCLSCPNKWAEITRPRIVVVKAQDRNGSPVELRGEDLLARAFCHEIDHLNGRLFIDMATEIVSEVPKKKRTKAKRVQ